MGNLFSSATDESESLPIDTTFKLPSPIPSWPPVAGDGFASGIIDLGGLKVCLISSFNKVWGTHEGGPDDLGVTFFEPSQIPLGFLMLGCYSQPNNRALFGWVLVGKDDSSTNTNGALKEPIDYTLVWKQ
ncbi:Vacuolar protein sorting-associated protein 62 [Quillaja saponaria]|uniref:Vacuolar protein sorting-associated protein 62 n=1 Tax=Quillaja saponaria TaxID=32244 RepID=A0AAD7L063_QUISA|nr:Vacuolar protein sorting-associated protein 62 [Quillaja saponaria]